MCLPCFKRKNSQIEYKELSTICEESDEFNILKCSYIWNKKIAVKNDINHVKIGKDRIIFANDEYFKFDYMLHFLKRTENVLTIVSLGIITNLNELKKADSICTINLKFTSEKNLDQFISDLRKHILIYKRYNSYDKSVKKYKNFKI